ncbi:MAG: hypothetical protein ABJD02_09665 [Paraglaciecola sp.]|uniref:hypothetical protein n=1 Tax=Paraglaciecola sp. TaxID=1920173 RepID=UPI003263C505
MAALAELVELYRYLNLPSIKEDFSIRIENCTLDANIAKKITNIWKEHSKFIPKIEVNINKKILSGIKDIDVLTENVDGNFSSLTIKLSRDGSLNFYTDLDDLIKRSNINSSGEMPSEFYICSDDYFCSPSLLEQLKPSNVVKLESFVEFISLIKKACHFVDLGITGVQRAIFLVRDENGKESTPKTIRLQLPKKLTELTSIDNSFLKEVIQDNESVHREERLSILRIALWDVLSNALIEDSDVYFVAVHWNEILDQYRSHYEIYIRGYSFSKFSGEVFDFIHETTKKANSLISDIAIKSLSIMSLFTVWLYLLRVKSIEPIFSIGLCATIVLSASIILFVIGNQIFLSNKLTKSSEKTFYRLRQKSKVSSDIDRSEKTEVAKLIDEESIELEKHLSKVRIGLVTIKIVIWIFIFISFFVTVEQAWMYESPPWLTAYTPSTILIVAIYCVFKILGRHGTNIAK